ncbi:hypothetical protein BD311DRAFT_454962 [Dichomitus squalens]|uniref:Uncharacterized protein n=1 Tax=Dichomitus squalens TaxID=114155 RepID=A0A4Q9MK02_9APHY|nr:hypothetical protein BD311DRAFT_454962 [Dichomitus squalens]
MAFSLCSNTRRTLRRRRMEIPMRHRGHKGASSLLSFPPYLSFPHIPASASRGPSYCLCTHIQIVPAPTSDKKFELLCVSLIGFIDVYDICALTWGRHCSCRARSCTPILQAESFSSKLPSLHHLARFPPSLHSP